MASKTGFYGLQKLVSGDPLSTGDYAFTNSNIDTIDRLLGKFNDALFEDDAPVIDPTDLLSLEVVPSGGLIPAGRTLRYKYTWVDAFGNESAASPESVVGTDAPITRPNQPGLTSTSTGGTLLAGNYFYIISAYATVNTSETGGSQAATINVRTGSTNKITLTFPSLPSGATGFNIFRKGPGEVQFFYLDSVDLNVATPSSIYVDDNSVTVNNSRTPSATNLTNSTNLVNITLPEAVPDGYTWKVYRTFVSADYNSSLLEWVVTTDMGVVVDNTVDSGLKTTIGLPPTVSSLTGASSKVAQATADVSNIYSILGTTPQGGFSDVRSRFDDIDTRLVETITVNLASSDFTLTSTTLTNFMTVALTGGSWIFEGQIFYTASTAEDLKVKMYANDGNATPFVWGHLVYQLDPDGLATPSTDGEVYTESSVVILKGNSSLRGATIHGAINWVSGSGNFYFDCAQRVTPATPVGTIIRKGSWFRFTRLG